MCARISDSSKSPEAGDKADVGLKLDILAARLRHATLDVVWRQWRALGAGAAARSGQGGHAPQALIDPEALLLVSLLLMSDERRLADLLHDWGARNSDLLSVQRVKNLAAAYPAEVQSQLLNHLTWFATIARDKGKDLRWRSIVGTQHQDMDAIDGSDADEEILHQELRNHSRAVARAGATATSVNPAAPRTRRGKARSTRARLSSDAAIILRLRLGFGVGVKADLLAYLLAHVHEWATVREISEGVAYTPAAVRRAAEDLAAARLVESLEGQPASYRITYEPWRELLGLAERPPRWASWQERFVFATAFLNWADAASARPLSPYALGTQGREFLERYRSALERDLVVVWSAHTKIQNWPAFLGQAVHDLAGWMEEMT